MHDTTMQKDAKTVVFTDSRSEHTDMDSLNDHEPPNIEDLTVLRDKLQETTKS